jgi:hypothetical protein
MMVLYYYKYLQGPLGSQFNLIKDNKDLQNVGNKAHIYMVPSLKNRINTRKSNPV